MLLAFLPLAACATTVAPRGAASLIAAERAFAEDAGQRGWIPAFRASVAPDGVELEPDPVNAADSLARKEDDHFTGLAWRPAFAGVARSGDLGFTTGPYFVRGRDGVRGHYFTVWRRQPDGAWKWIFDGGVAAADAEPIAADASVPAMRTAQAGDGAAAANAVAAIEVQIATGDALPAEALARRLAADARVLRAGAPPAVGRDAAAALIAGDAAMSFTTQRREVSAAGDLAFTFGEARGAGSRGYYARIWRRDRDGWRLVFDEIIPREAG